MENEAYPLVTSTNSTGDTATQGFNTEVLESLDPTNRQIVSDVLGLINTGKDPFYGSDFVHPEHIPQIATALAATTGKHDKTDPNAIAKALVDALKLIANATWNKQLSPNQVSTGAAYFPRTTGQGSVLGSVQPVQVLGYDPKRYRVTLHPYADSGTPGQIWIGTNQGDVSQAAQGSAPGAAFPLMTGNNNSSNTMDFYWGDTMYAALDNGSTVDTWLFWVIERYAD